MKASIRYLCGLSFALAATCCHAEEWSRFRGPNGEGQSEAKMPPSWTKDEFIWDIGLPGIGHSSPVIWGKRIFLTSADAEQGQRWLLCLKASDGTLQWKQTFPFKAYGKHAQNGYATSTPVVDSQRIYCAWATPDDYLVVALDHDGHELWRRDLGPFESKHGYGTSPILYKDMVIVTNDQDGKSTLQALNCADGTLRWQVPRKSRPEQNASYAVPCIYTPTKGPDELIVNSWSYGFSSIDPLSGETNWELAALPRRAVGSPIIVPGLILGNCGEGSGNNTLAAIRPGAKSGPSAEVVYTLDKTTSPYCTTLLASKNKDLVFLWGDRGIVSCIDARTGKVHWRERVGGNYFGSPVRVGDKIFCMSTSGSSTKGELVALAASEKYELLGRTELGDSSHSTPALAGARMYLRTESHLICVEGK